MTATLKTDMLLFCKEVTPYPRKYVLYFVDMRTYYDPKPRIHRFLCPWRRFSAFEPGTVYDLSVMAVRIHDAQASTTVDIAESDYQALMEARALRFIPLSEARYRQRRKLPIYDPCDYYSFADTKEILSYSDTPLMRAWLWLVHALCTTLAFLLPAAVYLLLLYNGISTVTPHAAMRIPLLALAALPLMVYAMFMLVSLVEMLHLRWPYTRWPLLRRRVLLSGAKRQTVRFSIENRKKYILWGGICFGILALMWLILLLAGLLR